MSSLKQYQDHLEKLQSSEDGEFKTRQIEMTERAIQRLKGEGPKMLPKRLICKSCEWIYGFREDCSNCVKCSHPDVLSRGPYAEVRFTQPCPAKKWPM